MFRQMAHLKCLRQGISNFNETLDLVYELFLISPEWRGKKTTPSKTKIQQFAEKSIFSKFQGRVTNFKSARNSGKTVQRTISYQNEYGKHGMNRLKEF